MDAGLAAGSLSPLADHARADLGARDYPKIDFQDAYYYSAPKQKIGPKSLDEVDPEILRTYEKLGIPLQGAGNPRRRAQARRTEHAR